MRKSPVARRANQSATRGGTAIYVVLLALAAQPAMAQDNGAGSVQPQEGEGDQPTLGDIVVTAQRRSESVQRTPVTVSAFDSEMLQKSGFQGPNDLSAIVPNVQVSEVYGRFQPIFTIRGIGQSDYNSNQTSPVGVYADEAYIGPVYLHGTNFFDVERVEVLRGPQGTLYGKNTTAGAINLISRKPDPSGQTAGNLSASYGNYKAVAIEGGIETPLVQDKLAARIAFTYNDDEGYQRDVTNDRRLAETHFWGVRSTLVFKPSDGFEATLRYTHSETNQMGTAPRVEGTVPVPGLGNVDFTGYQRGPSLGYYDREDNFTRPLKIKSDFAVLGMTLDAGGFDLVSTSSFISAKLSQQVNLDGSPVTLLDYSLTASNRSFSQDVRLVTTGREDLKLIIGGYYGYQRDKTNATYFGYNDPLYIVRASDPVFANLLEQFGAVSNRQTIVRKSLAAYSQGRWEFAPRFGVDLGLRFTSDIDSQPYHNISRLDRNGTPIGSYLPGNISEALLGVPVDNAFVPPMPGLPSGAYLSGPYTDMSDAPIRVRNNRVTGKLGIDYKPSLELMFYASYSRGYRSGNFLGGNYYIPRTLDEGVYAKPETVDAYEIGAKADLLNRRLRVNAAVFQYDYQNQQFINVVGLSNVLVNAGKSRIRGAEIETVVRVADGLTVQATASYLDSKFIELMLGDPRTDYSTSIDLSGNQLISSPKYNATFALDYTTTLSGPFKLALHADGSYRSKQWFSAYNEQVGYDRNKQDRYALVNGQISIKNEDKKYYIDLWVKNIFEKRYDTYSINLARPFGYSYFTAGPPRTYGVRVGYSF